MRICAKLNHDNVQSIAAGSKINARTTWNLRYVEAILTNRAVIGEYQPCRVIDGKRVPEGEPINDYFPRVIEDELFYQVQAAQETQITSGACRSAGCEHLHGGILRDARTGSTMRLQNASQSEHKGGKGSRAHCLVPC